jgi:dolichol-phosphate mannosyltransferase
MRPVVTVITPVFNERRNLAENVSRIKGVLSSRSAPFELVIVDDNSPDGSGMLADELAEEYGFIKVLHRPERRGLGTAYKDGFALAEGDFIVSMDSDLSHDPRYLPTMLREAENADIVIGSRFVEGGMIVGRSIWRDILSIFANRMIRMLTRASIRDWTSGLRVYRRTAWETIMPRVNCDKWDFQFESLYKAVEEGLRVRETPITFYERADGSSKFSSREALGFIRSFFRICLSIE